MSLDDIDKQILKELKKNARLPIAKLAHRVSLSRNAVRQRVERLERDQIIAGYTLKIGDGIKNEDKISAFMFILRKDRMRGNDIIQAISANPEVISCHIVSGELDLVVRLEATSQEKISGIWKELSNLPGIVDISTSFILSSAVESNN